MLGNIDWQWMLLVILLVYCFLDEKPQMKLGSHQYVIYENPLDARGKFLVRRFFLVHGPEATAVGITDSLKAARALVPQKTHGHRIDRLPQDEPQILEVWMSEADATFVLKALNEKVV